MEGSDSAAALSGLEHVGFNLCGEAVSGAAQSGLAHSSVTHRDFAQPKGVIAIYRRTMDDSLLIRSERCVQMADDSLETELGTLAVVVPGGATGLGVACGPYLQSN
jgi:hypothetical protein